MAQLLAHGFELSGIEGHDFGQQAAQGLYQGVKLVVVQGFVLSLGAKQVEPALDE